MSDGYFTEAERRYMELRTEFKQAIIWLCMQLVFLGANLTIMISDLTDVVAGEPLTKFSAALTGINGVLAGIFLVNAIYSACGVAKKKAELSELKEQMREEYKVAKVYEQEIECKAEDAEEPADTEDDSGTIIKIFDTKSHEVYKINYNCNVSPEELREECKQRWCCDGCPHHDFCMDSGISENCLYPQNWRDTHYNDYKKI